MSSHNLPEITTSGVISALDTSQFFLPNYSEPNLSPVDQYIENNRVLNLIPLSGSYSKEMASIIILGYMSAVESYLRAVCRGVIGIDEHAQKLVEKMEITYAAAVYHDRQHLPEALFESTSLANPYNIKSILREYIGIKGNLPSDVRAVLVEFSKVCEIRHCCVHRFGKLGAKNAIRLGLSLHSSFLEKPFIISQNDLEEISHILRAVVNTINRFVYECLLERMARNQDSNGIGVYSENWTWNYNRDKRRFLRYYNLFRTTRDTVPSPQAIDIYNTYRTKFKGA